MLAMILIPILAAMQTPDKDRLDWFREARFGMFIHWGLYSVPAGTWGDQTGHAEWIRETAHIPVNEYEKLLKQFNPVKFDADAWVKMAKDAGMKYIVITSKHHDGFDLFDSKVSDFDVMATPFHRDIMKELSEACRKQGMKMCWYHSIMDWHHPDYLPRRSWENRPVDGADFSRYVKYLHDQVTELLTNYGPIGIMWFDGEWEKTWNHELGQPLYDLCRKLQPNVIVNNRVDIGRGGMGGLSDAGFAGDYGTPEQEIPATGIPGVDWETCMTMNDHWGYNSHDKNFKSTKEIIRMLCDITSKGGNYLLNIGPTSEGVFPPESVQRLKEIGDWMKVNSEAIYGTHASPFKKLDWGRCTVNGNKLYLHVFDWPADGKLVVPGLGNQPTHAYVLGKSGQRLPVTRNGTDIVISVPPKMPDENCTVVGLALDGKPVVYEMPEIKTEITELVKPTKVEIATTSPDLQIRYTVDGSDPDESSAVYQGPVTISDNATLKARSFYKGKAVSGVASASFKKVAPMLATLVSYLQPGLHCAMFKGDWDALPNFATLTPAETKTLTTVGASKEEFVGRRFTGYIDVPTDDVYLFSLTSDDGAKLLIDGRVIVDNDGLHSSIEKRGTAPLAKGWHPIEVQYFNKTGGSALDLSWAPAGGKLEQVAAKSFGSK